LDQTLSTGGFQGLSARRRGRRAGEQAALTEPQQQEVIALVRETTPDQLGLPEFLWTREAVAELIARRDGVRLARTTMGADLRGWGFSPRSHRGGPWSRTRPRYAAG
jgi:transposase